MNEDLKQNMKKRFSSRKLHVTIVGFVSATIFMYSGQLSGELWVDFTTWLFTVYIAGNAAQHASEQFLNFKAQNSELDT